MKTTGLVRRYYELNQRIKSLEKVKNKLNALLKKELPFGISIWGNYKVDKQEIEEHLVPSHIMPGHIRIIVKRK